MKSVVKQKLYLLPRNICKKMQEKKQTHLGMVGKQTHMFGILTSACNKLNVRLIYVGK